MHRACDAERDLPCNAYCAGDVHADLAYMARWVPLTAADALDSLRAAADWRAQIGEVYPMTILSVVPATEAPPLHQRYPAARPMGADDTIQAYLVRYRVDATPDAPPPEVPDGA